MGFIFTLKTLHYANIWQPAFSNFHFSVVFAVFLFTEPLVIYLKIPESLIHLMYTLIYLSKEGFAWYSDWILPIYNFFPISRLLAPIKRNLSERWNNDSTACRKRCTNKLLQGTPGCEHTAHHMLCRSSATCSFSSLLCALTAQNCTSWYLASQQELVSNIYLFRLHEHAGPFVLNMQNHFLLGVTAFWYL